MITLHIIYIDLYAIGEIVMGETTHINMRERKNIVVSRIHSKSVKRTGRIFCVAKVKIAKAQMYMSHVTQRNLR